MDLPVYLLMVLCIDPLTRFPTWYYYPSWARRMHFVDGVHLLSPFILLIFWEYVRYQPNRWPTIDKRYRYFVDDYVGLVIGFHNDIVCPVQIVSIVDIFTYHSKLVAIQIWLLLVKLSWSIVTNNSVWKYGLLDPGRHEKCIVWVLCKFPQPKQITLLPFYDTRMAVLSWPILDWIYS